MKKISFIVALCATATALGQPVITAAQLPAALETEALIAETAGFDPGTPGPDKVWDFSALVVAPVGVNNIVPPAETPAATLFNTATHCIAYAGVFNETFQYFRADAAKLELIGEVYTGIIALNYAQNPKTNVQFPYVFNTVINDTYQSNFDDEPTAFTATYDAYGTLIMPFGTYQAIRQTIVENGQTDYIWYNVAPFFPIIQTAMADNTMGIMKNTAILASDSFQKNGGFTLSPNPTSGTIAINLGQADSAQVDLFDLTGKRVAGHNISQKQTHIHLDAPSGIYMVRIIANGQTFVQKIIKK